MKRMVAMVAIGVWACLVCGGVARAEDPADEGEKLDEQATTPAGTQQVTEKLVNEFGVTAEQVQGLRDQHMGFGEIHHALSLAKTMPGGLTDDNLKSVLDLRQEQHMGWGQIAHALDTKPTTSEPTTPQAQSVTREGSTPGRSGQSHGLSTGGGSGPGAGLERAGGRANGHSVGHGPSGVGGASGGLGHGGGWGGKSGSAPGHNR